MYLFVLMVKYLQIRSIILPQIGDKYHLEFKKEPPSLVSSFTTFPNQSTNSVTPANEGDFVQQSQDDFFSRLQYSEGYCDRPSNCYNNVCLSVCVSVTRVGCKKN